MDDLKLKATPVVRLVRTTKGSDDDSSLVKCIVPLDDSVNNCFKAADVNGSVSTVKAWVNHSARNAANNMNDDINNCLTSVVQEVKIEVMKTLIRGTHLTLLITAIMTSTIATCLLCRKSRWR